MINNLFFAFFILVICACGTQKNAIITEQHRPQFHFTPPKMWMNDPNGLLYHEGEYHLCYQYYPDSTVWGPMHWGHAVSKDMLHWKHLPIALYPDQYGYIFSGSVVVDENNTSGFQKGAEKPLVAIFTYHSMAGEKAGTNDFQTQGIAYSLDKGRTWAKYTENPVIKNTGIKDFRDPKVQWHSPTQQWIMTLAVADHVEFYASKNLKNWQKVGEFGKTEGAHGGVWECPDLFPLKIDGESTEKWVLLLSIGNGAPNGGSGTQYFIGDFDGKSFKNDNTPDNFLWFDYGRDNYAGVTWHNAPNNRRLFLGWMSNWQYAQKVPTQTWRSAMTLPRELSLKNTPNGIRLFQKAVNEQITLKSNETPLASQTIEAMYPLKNTSKCNEITLNFDISRATSQDFGVVLSNTKGEKVWVGYEKSTNRFYIDRTDAGKKDFEAGFAGRHYAPRSATSDVLKMNLHIDVSSVELFADDGAVAMTDVFFPNEDFNALAIFSKGGEARLLDGRIWKLK
nr:putative GH32 family protein [Micrasema longulum]